SLASQLALILFAGATTALTITHRLSVPEAIALIVVIARYLEPFTSISELGPALESTRATLDRIRAVLSAPIMTAGAETRRGHHDAPLIEFEDVTFGYGGTSAPVLDGVSFALQPGTTTAIVGPSGSGKSTILSLIAGLYQPAHGRVLVDGVDVATLDADARRAASSVVFQHPYLFHGTIRENVSAGDLAAGDAQFNRAVALARVDELTGRLPAGDATIVGEAGSALSGGERQRVSIARALLKPASILLVDEATSALDTENEAAVVDALTADPGDRRPPAGQHPARRPGSFPGHRQDRRGRHGRRIAHRGWTIRRVLASAARRRRVANPRRLEAIRHAATWGVATDQAMS